MSATSMNESEAQFGTRDVPANSSTGPFEEKAMSDSSSSTGSGSTGSGSEMHGQRTDSATRSTPKEIAMSDSTNVPVPGSGEPTDSATTSSATAPEIHEQIDAPEGVDAGDGSSDGGKPKKPKEKSRKVGERYKPTYLEDLAAKARAKSEPHQDDPMVRADLATLDEGLKRLQHAKGRAHNGRGAVDRATVELQAAEAKLHPFLTVVLWALRITEDGAAYVRGQLGDNLLQTAENILETLPTSGYVVPGELVRSLEAALPAARAVLDAHQAAEAERDDAIAEYHAACQSVTSAVMMLNASVKRAQGTKRILALPPLKHRPAAVAPAPAPVPLRTKKKA